MRPLELYPVEDMVKELQERNISFVIGWVDHQQFNKTADGIVWATDHGGVLPLKKLLVGWIDTMLKKIEDTKFPTLQQDGGA